ncbi:hypothetical protein BKA62DRAFT_691779 [Auriculariales sp. MPI-PUGE-AT-0066]|nr:hypothetical protein BKA62DRAFT_691779 [Auriculariales sp. MPI-PUGE-AT-0066]
MLKRILLASLLSFTVMCRADNEKRLRGWYARATFLEPQPTALPMSNFLYGVEESTWGEHLIEVMLFSPDLAVDTCGSVYQISPHDHHLMALATILFSASQYREKEWNRDIGIHDHVTTRVVGRMPTLASPNRVVSSSVYAWPMTELPKAGWYWDMIRWRNQRLEQLGLGWLINDEPAQQGWPREMDNLITLASEATRCSLHPPLWEGSPTISRHLSTEFLELRSSDPPAQQNSKMNSDSNNTIPNHSDL